MGPVGKGASLNQTRFPARKVRRRVETQLGRPILLCLKEMQVSKETVGVGCRPSSLRE